MTVIVSSTVELAKSSRHLGEWIWGRGSSDDKSGLIGIMITLETLFAKGYVPKRTIVLGFGAHNLLRKNGG